MKMQDRERAQRDIREAFDFVRFLLKNPKELKRIKNGSEVRIVPFVPETMTYAGLKTRNVQTFTAETVFHPL